MSETGSGSIILCSA